MSNNFLFPFTSYTISLKYKFTKKWLEKKRVCFKANSFLLIDHQLLIRHIAWIKLLHIQFSNLRGKGVKKQTAWFESTNFMQILSLKICYNTSQWKLHEDFAEEIAALIEADRYI